jgi:hypothetical protein
MTEETDRAEGSPQKRPISLGEQRLRGSIDLVHDAVEHGSRAIEDIHLATAARPFELLDRVPPIAAPVRAVRAIHDATVTFSYGMVRLVTTAVATTAHSVLDVVAR